MSFGGTLYTWFPHTPRLRNGDIERRKLEDLAPYDRATGAWGFDGETDSTQECRIERYLYVGTQNGETAIGFHSLKQVTDLDVGLTVEPYLGPRRLVMRLENCPLHSTIQAFFQIKDQSADRYVPVLTTSACARRS